MRLLLLILAFAFIGHWAYFDATAQPQSGNRMPAGFETVRFGMTAEELRAVRARAVKEDFYGSGSWYEALPKGRTFSSALYDLRDNKLWRLTLSNDVDSARVAEVCATAFREMVKAAGSDYTPRLGVMGRSPSKAAPAFFPVVVWHTPSAWIALRCVRSDSTEPFAPNHVELVMVTRDVPFDTGIKTRFKADASKEEIETSFRRVLPEAVGRH